MAREPKGGGASWKNKRSKVKGQERERDRGKEKGNLAWEGGMWGSRNRGQPTSLAFVLRLLRFLLSLHRYHVLMHSTDTGAVLFAYLYFQKLSVMHRESKVNTVTLCCLFYITAL